MNKKIIAISGPRGSGKTTIAKLIAKLLSWEYADLDAIIEKMENQKIKDLVAEKGWPYFRKCEKKAVKGVVTGQKIVIGLGGGTIIDDENYSQLKNTAYIIFLHCEPRAAAKRIVGCTNRPRLTNHTDPQRELEELWQQRLPIYQQRCDLSLETSLDMNSRQLEEYIFAKISHLFP